MCGSKIESSLNVLYLLQFENRHLYPIEIENVIITHPSVADVAVFGRSDDLFQELITAAVVLKHG